MHMENYKTNSQKINELLEKSLDQHGFVGGDSPEYVISKKEIIDDSLEGYQENDYDESDFLEVLNKWHEYMALFDFDTKGMSPSDVKNSLENDINNYRIDLADLKNKPEILNLSQEEQIKQYELIATKLRDTMNLLQRVEDFLMTHRNYFKE